MPASRLEETEWYARINLRHLTVETRFADRGRVSKEAQRVDVPVGKRGPQLDLTDRRILDALQADARLSMRELARRVSLSAPAVGRRVRRLEEEGVIVGYCAQVEPARVGLGLTAFVDVTPHGPAASARLVAAVPKMREVVECHRLTGQRSYLLKVAVPSADELERLIDTLMTFGRTATSVVLSSPVRRGPALQEAAGGRAPETSGPKRTPFEPAGTA